MRLFLALLLAVGLTHSSNVSVCRAQAVATQAVAAKAPSAAPQVQTVATQTPAAGPQAPAPLLPDDPLLRGLDANLYMQTSAEYRAACYQAYNLALLKLKLAYAAAEKRDAANSDAAKRDARPMAVVMDLDETVLDNAGFQAFQLRSGIAYDQRLWDLWEERHSEHVALVPGAKEFILAAEEMKFQIFHISNRNDKFKAPAKAALARLGIPAASDDHLKFATTTSDKTARRAEVEAKANVVLYIGDNLRDFDDKFKSPKLEATSTPAELEAAIQTRKDAVDAERAKFGEKFILLPNPAYGEWTKPLGRGKRDLDRLAPQLKNP
jgi:5'-nucleotidase (lipoprotein e(P4) family)